MRVRAETLAFLGQKPHRRQAGAGLVEIDGLPLGAVDRLVKTLAASEALVISLIGLKPSTYYRRKRHGEALHVWRPMRFCESPAWCRKRTRAFGSDEQAHAWLVEPSAHLEDNAPLNLLGSDGGVHAVEYELGRIEWGVF